jgi:SAM-dependent methyltransferase
MNKAMYAVDARIEQEHWWFVGRRRLFSRMIRGLRVETGAPVLDVGTSAGTNLRMLRDLGFTDVTGLDLSLEAIRFCMEKGLGSVKQGDVTAMPFDDQSFALVVATDIIEHVDDDLRGLTEIRRVLRPGGVTLLAVPAFPSLWGFQDEVGHHKRRYRMQPLLERIEQAGLIAGERFHYNYLLFGPIWFARRIMKHLKHSLQSEGEVNSPLVNKVLSAVFSLDIATAPKLAPPFGVSILVVARRPG